MRFGVIGAGRWGRNIVRTLRAMPAIEVACVASRNPATRDLVNPRCVIEADWHRLLRRSDLDCVAVATPPAFHAEMIAEAVSAGLPVFVEKPLTCDLSDAECLLDLVGAKGGYVLVDHVHLFSRPYRELKAHLSAVGRVARVDGDAGGWGPFRPDTPVLWDWGPHDAAFCVDLLNGQPDAVRARYIERRPTAGALGERLMLSAEYANAVAVEIRLSNLLESKRRCLLVEGPGGTLTYDDCAQNKLVYAPATGGDVELFDVSGPPPLVCALSQFVLNVSTGRTSLDDLRLGVDVVRLLAAWEACLGSG
jgi:predicted dehydrogenase